MAERLIIVRARRALLIAALALVVLPAAAWPQSVAVQYQRLTQREQAARRSSKTTVAALRTLARAYENFTRRHPVSGYSDNALWQAAGLYESIHARTHDDADREAMVRYLTWLKREYPSGKLARQSAAKLNALAAASSGPAPAAQTARSAPPAPVPFPKPAAESTAANTPARETPRESAPARAAAPPESETERPIASTPLPPPPATREPASPVLPIAIDGVTYAALPKGDRLIVTFSAEANYSSSRTANPDRVYIELPDAGAAPAVAASARQITGTLVQSVAVARATNGSARLVLQLMGTPRYSTFPLYDPFRLVIDVESDAVVRTAPEPVVATGVVKAASSEPAVEPASVSGLPRRAADDVVAAVAVTPPATKAGDYSLARQLGLGVSRIVIDPGHGGHDPGATANGVTEADLVLDIALRLEKILKRQGDSEVVLTRRTDEFIPLEERTAIANREHADMFISIHGNASSRKAASGIETFFLDFASNPYAQSVAARENATSAQNMRVLPELVKTIALTNKLKESRELADVVQSSLVKRLKPKDPGAKDLGVKRAPFVVLIGAQMPSVLAEVSFLTNRAEASLLKQGAYRERIAQALADAIVKYRDTLKKTETVSARNAG